MAKRDTTQLSLTQAQFEFTLMVAKLIFFAYEKGYTLSFGEAYRSNEQAEINALGSTGRANLATHLKDLTQFRGLAKALEDNVGSGIAKSAHTQRLAVDLMLFKNGKYLTNSADYIVLGEFWEAIGGSWGGRFKSADGNHFSLNFRGIE